MSIIKLTPRTLRRSRLGEQAVMVPGQGAGTETSLARVQVEENEARAWRVTLNRAERNDLAPPLIRAIAPNNSSPIFLSQIHGYAAGLQNTPQNPPVRDRPVAATATDGDPLLVEIAWGMSTAAPHRLIAHWPMEGSSITVYGSYVEVWAGAFLIYSSIVPLPPDVPRLTATITPADGLAVTDAGELGIEQESGVTTGYAAAGDPAVFYVPDYARRVRVVLSDVLTGRVFDFGHPRAHLEWWDDRLAVAFSVNMQGTSIGVPPEWHPVPARACLLRVGTPGANLACGETPFTESFAHVQWRIAP